MKNLMKNSERYQIRLSPAGNVMRIPHVEAFRLAPVGTVRHMKLDPDQMDLNRGVIVYDESSVEPINMAATKLVGANSMTAIRGAVLFGVLDEDGIPQTAFDEATADWIEIWARGRCTVCGCADKPLLWPAFPISNGRCCEKCDAVMRSVRSYMGIGNWQPREPR